MNGVKQFPITEICAEPKNTIDVPRTPRISIKNEWYLTVTT